MCIFNYYYFEGIGAHIFGANVVAANDRTKLRRCHIPNVVVC